MRDSGGGATPPSTSFSTCIAEAGGGVVAAGGSLQANFAAGSMGTNDGTFFPGFGGGNGVLVQQTDATWLYWFSCELDAAVQAGAHRLNETILSGDIPPRPFKAQTRTELLAATGGTDPFDTSLYLQNAVSVTTSGSDYELTCTYFNDTLANQTVNGFGFWATKLGAGFSF